VKSKHIKHKQVVSQDSSQRDAQLPNIVASCPINVTDSNSAASQNIKCVKPMTFSQKLYQNDQLEIAEQFELALEANSLEKIKILLDKLVKVGK